MNVETAAFPVPFVRDGVNDDDVVVEFLGLVNALDVLAWIIWSGQVADVIVCDVGVEIAATVFSVNESDFAAQAFSDEERAESFACARCASESKAELRFSFSSF